MKTDEFLTTIREHYDIIRTHTGHTGSRVFFLRHKTLEEKIVLKIYPEKNDIYLFLKTISFENLPTIYDTYELDDGFAILEEYIDGITVSEVLESGLYTYRGAKAVISNVCDALKILHNHGFIHRDIKPENVIISKDGIVKVIDFNVSRRRRENQNHDTEIMGTIGYASPEQLGISQTDSGSDIYSTGVLLNVMLTGKHPSDMLAKGKAGRIVLKCTQIHSDKRYANITQLRDAL